ncbi:unnamed protein product [Discula destructiva]
MDDPWGSPWASNDPNPILEPPPLPPLPRASTTPLELPGRTLARDRSSTTISPWAVEDNGFDDWAAVDSRLSLPPTAATPGSAWSGWGGDNALNSSHTHLPARTREGSLGLPSPAWPPASSPGLSPGLFPVKTVSRRSSSRSLSRQPTPDPWANETSENRLSLPPAVHIAAEQAAFATLDSHDEVEEQDLDESPHDEPSAATGLGIGGTEFIAPESERYPDIIAERGRIVNENACEETKGLEGHEPVQNQEAQSGSPSVSRHSSMSNESQQDDRLDSPITSMDEDTSHRPRISRRMSTQLPSTAESSDGLAQRTDSSTLLVPQPDGARRLSASRSVGSFRSIGTDGVSDFGDFEDAEDFASEVPSRQPSVSGSRPSSRAGRMHSGSRPSLRLTAATLGGVAAPSPISEEPSRFEDIRARFGSVQFTPDKDLVDKLFDVAKLEAEQPPAKDYSLDTVDGIIHDSFTTISERKTWYRISRAGTMRKHDLGDDDNYRRVTWAGSQVKEDATKIVRRWMEENAYYAGRPKAGGGPMVRGVGFDWDSSKSKAEPLSFDEIFGKRKSIQTPRLSQDQSSRPVSLQSPAHARSASDGVKSLPPRSSLSIPAPPAGLAFGWSSGGSGASTPASVRPTSLMRQSLDVHSMKSGSSRPPSIRQSEDQPPVQLAQPPLKRIPDSLILSGPTKALQNDEDDDDEWGEMVASPALDTHPANDLFGAGLDDSISNLSAPGLASPVKMPETTATLNSVSCALENPANATKDLSQDTSTAGPVDVWDFSAFDSTPLAPPIPPTATSKPEFDFDTPLQSPTLSIPSRTASPASIHSSKPPTPTIPSQSGSPVIDLSRAPITPSRTGSPVPEISRVPTPPMTLRPGHSSKSSLSIVRPSPLHNVLTPDVASPALAASPSTQPPPLPKTVSFAADDEPVVDDAAVTRIVGSLPDLSYMLR